MYVTTFLFWSLIFNSSLTAAAVSHQKRACSFNWYASDGDTCASMASAWDITEADFISYNPGVNCNGLIVGNHYCVEWSGEPPSAPSTTSKPTSTRSTSFVTSTSTSTGPTAPGPTQEGITSGCLKWHLAKSTTTCIAIVDYYGTFSLAQFYEWNPPVKNDCSALWVGYYYCVAVAGTPTQKPSSTKKTSKTTSSAPVTTGPAKPAPTQSGLVANCAKFHLVKSTTTCAGIIDYYGTFTLSQFYSWNPAVGKNCESLWLGYYVCVGVPGTPTTRPATTTKPTTTKKTTTSATKTTAKPGPSPTQANVNKNCKKWHLVKSTTTCQGIADYNNISLSNFYKWNPDVNSQCTNLWLGYYVCAGV